MARRIGSHLLGIVAATLIISCVEKNAIVECKYVEGELRQDVIFIDEFGAATGAFGPTCPVFFSFDTETRESIANAWEASEFTSPVRPLSVIVSGQLTNPRPKEVAYIFQVETLDLSSAAVDEKDFSSQADWRFGPEYSKLIYR